MKKLIAVLAFGVFPMLFSLAAYASCNATGCSGVGDQVIRSVYVTGLADGRVFLQAPESSRGNLNCTLVEGHYMTLRASHPLFKEAYAAILTGLSAGNRLHVRINAGSPICEVSYVRMFM